MSNEDSGFCHKCDKDIIDNNDSVQCDRCDSVFHVKCIGANKTECKARNNSKCLKIYCCDCIELKDNGTEDDIKTIMRFIYKLDLSQQQSKALNTQNNALLLQMVERLNTVERRIGVNLASECSILETNTQSYANAVKKRTAKPIAVIKPKQKQNSKATLVDTTSKIDKSSVGVCNTRNAKNGSVVLSCVSESETMKVKQLVTDSLGDDYDVLFPKVKKPRLRISNIDDDLERDDIIPELERFNKDVQGMGMSIVTVIRKKVRGNTWNDIVVEVDNTSYKKLVNKKILNLPWRECKISQHLYLKRCFKCCGYSHISTECKHEQKCSKCAEHHKFDTCTSNSLCCINCKLTNEKYKMNLDTRHHAFSRKCSVLQRRMDKLQNIIEYNDKI